MANLRNFTRVNEELQGTGINLVENGSRISFSKGLASSDDMQVSYWTQGDVDMLQECIAGYKEDGDLKGLWNTLKHYDASYTDVSDEYAKDSYRDGKARTIEIIETAFKGCGYSQQMLAKLESFDYDNTSARLYKGVYVTPSMVRVCIDYVLGKMTVNQLKDLEKLIDCKIKDIAKVTWDRLGADEELEELETIDLIRGV